MYRYLFLIVFLSYLIYQRIQSTFAKTERKTNNVTDQIFASAMILIYAVILIVGVVDFLNQERVQILQMVFGLILFCSAVFLRTAARKALGTNWSLYLLTLPKKIINLGPYHYSRHPYYLGTFLELISFGILFHSTRSFWLTCIIYLPLVFIRILIEEDKLRKKFGMKYLQYRSKTPMIVSLRVMTENRFSEMMCQISGIVNYFGLQRLKEIKHLNRDITQYARDYYIAQSLAALIKVGLVDYLNRHEKVHLTTYSQGNDYDFGTLKNICDYLSIVRVMRKDGMSYSFTQKGQEMTETSRGIFSLVYAYAPIFENLDKLIAGKIKYGKDIYRRGEFVGRGSAELARILPFPTSARLMKKYHCNSILDLGCGSGEFLIDICQHDGIQGFGIDLSAEAIAFAKAESKRKGLAEEKIHFEVGDIFKLDKCLNGIDHVDMVAVMFVLHEFIANRNYDTVVKILVQIRNRFPRSFILICELCRAPLKQLQKRPSGVAEHHLFHALSNQKIASLKEWRKIFKTARLKLCEEYRFDLAEQGYFVLKNAFTP